MPPPPAPLLYVQHSLEGLAAFSHVWILFLFHQNSNVAVKAKVIRSIEAEDIKGKKGRERERERVCIYICVCVCVNGVLPLLTYLKLVAALFIPVVYLRAHLRLYIYIYLKCDYYYHYV